MYIQVRDIRQACIVIRAKSAFARASALNFCSPEMRGGMVTAAQARFATGGRATQRRTFHVASEQQRYQHNVIHAR